MVGEGDSASYQNCPLDMLEYTLIMRSYRIEDRLIVDFGGCRPVRAC